MVLEYLGKQGPVGAGRERWVWPVAPIGESSLFFGGEIFSLLSGGWVGCGLDVLEWLRDFGFTDVFGLEFGLGVACGCLFSPNCFE